MKVEKLELIHQALIEEKFRNLNTNISEYSFANLYLFRHVHHYEVLFDQEIWIRGRTRDGLLFIMPTISPALLKDVRLPPIPLYPIQQDEIVYFEPHILQASICDAESDYLFSVEKLANYPGRSLSKKRNLVKQFLDHHAVKSFNYTSDYKEEAQAILNHWMEQTKGQEADFFPFMEAVERLDQLHLHGRIFYVDDQPEGLMIGEWLNDNCYVLHFNKARKDILGLYQYMYQDLAKSLEGTCKLINLEQDLGLPTLRQAKHSYQPDLLIHKWRLTLVSEKHPQSF